MALNRQMPFRIVRFFSKLLGGRLHSHPMGTPNLACVGWKMKIFSLQHFPTRGVASGPGTRGLAGRPAACLPACLAPARPGEILQSPRNFFNSRPVRTKFVMHGTWDHGRLPTDFRRDRASLKISLARGSRRGRWGGVPREAPRRPTGHCRPARGKTESQKLFQFCTDPNQIWHARHLGPWATAQQIWEESDDFEFLASRELGQGAGEDALAGKRPTGAPAPASPARGKITQSQKIFYFLDYLHQIWHAWHLGPWATAHRFWAESDRF